MRLTTVAIAIVAALTALPAWSQSESDIANQIRAASRWPQAAQEARDAGVPVDDVAEFFRIVRENEYLSRDVRRLLLAVALQASAWGPETIVGEVSSALEGGDSPHAVREMLLAGPPPGEDGEWAPRSGMGSGDRTGRHPGEENEPGRTWEPGSGQGLGNGTGRHQDSDRDWPSRSGEGPRDRSGVGRQEGSQ